jgi:arsenate reductase (glutaredoxin)
MNEDRIVVYEKTTCSTCRSLVQLLKEHGIEFERVDYMIDPLPKEKLKDLLGKMRMVPRELLRTREPIYRDLGLASLDYTDEQLLEAMVAHPELVQRPIVERGDLAVLARPVERVREVL